MQRYFLLLFLALITFQGTNLSYVHAQSTLSSIANETDYKFVFDQMESRIETAPNIVNNAELEEYLNGLSCELSKQYCREIRIHVIDEPDFNAHMFPNGALVIYTGLLLRLDNKAQLAYVISHELAHYIYKHGIRKINHTKSVGNTLNQTSDFNPFRGMVRFNSTASINKYSRQLEHDADLFSIKLLSKNNLSLVEVAVMFENLRQEKTVGNKVNKGGFFSSHPGTKERIKLFTQEAVKSYTRKSQLNDSWVFLRARFSDQWINSELSKREFKSSQVLLNRLKRNSNNPSYYDFYLGEIYRKQGGKKNAKNAIFYYEKYLRNNQGPLNARVYKSLGESYMELNSFGKATDYYHKYINLSPEPSDAHIIRSELAQL